MPSSTPPICASESRFTYGRSDPRGTYSIAMYGVPRVLEVLVHGDDVRVVERPRQPRLAQEPMGELGRARVEPAQLLERDLAVEVGLPREVDDRHAAAADLAQDLIATDCSRAHGHRAP